MKAPPLADIIVLGTLLIGLIMVSIGSSLFSPRVGFLVTGFTTISLVFRLLKLGQ